MPFDSKSLSSQARKAYIETGKQFGSSDTLAQAAQTLSALKAYGERLSTFSPADTTRLSEVRTQLSAAVDGRRDAQGTIKITNKGYHDALAAGKVAWLSGRTVLENSRSDLWESSEQSAGDALRQLDTALEQTRTAEKDAEKLAGQLDVLLRALGGAEEQPSHPLLVQAAQSRGGEAAVKALSQQATALKEIAKQAKAQGTPTETEEMDLFDGIIVTLARKARKAAREADKKEGTKSLSKEFVLDKLYQSTGRKKPKTEGTEPVAS